MIKLNLPINMYDFFLGAMYVNVWSISNSQFNGLIPHDDISRQNEGLDVDDVCVSALRPHVQPLTLKGKVAKRDPEKQDTKEERD